MAAMTTRLFHIVLVLSVCFGCRNKAEPDSKADLQPGTSEISGPPTEKKVRYVYADNPKLAIDEVLGDWRTHSIGCGPHFTENTYPFGGAIRFSNGEVKKFAYISEGFEEAKDLITVTTSHNGSTASSLVPIATVDSKVSVAVQRLLWKAEIDCSSFAQLNTDTICVPPQDAKRAMTLLQKDSKSRGYKFGEIKNGRVTR